MYKLYKKCNKRYAYSHYKPEKYVRPMSWKGTILCTLAFLFSRTVWHVILDTSKGLYPFTSIIALFYFVNSLYVDYIFCKYEYFGKSQNIDEQARRGDWLSCLYIADSFLVLVGSISAVFLFASSWHLLPVKVCALILLCVSIFLVLPIFQVTSRKMTLLWCILRVVLYGTIQRTGFVIAFFTLNLPISAIPPY